MLQDYFEVTVRIEQAHGQWLTLDAEDRSHLACDDDSESLHAVLGGDLIVGERCWDVQSKFRVRLGPLRYEAFRRFMPGASGLRALGKMTRAYVGPELDFDVQPTLQPDEPPWCRLSAEEPEPQCLGWDAWIRNESFVEEVGDAVFEVEEETMEVAEAA
jgi:type VI secretion system protein ImpH